MTIDKRGFVGNMFKFLVSLIPFKLKAEEAKKSITIEEYKKQAFENFPYKTIVVKGENALFEWEKLKKADKFHPIILGNADVFYEMIDIFSPEYFKGIDNNIAIELSHPIQTTLEKAEKINFPADLSKWDGAIPTEELDAPIGKWPSKLSKLSYGLNANKDILTDRFYDKVYIALIPTKNSWEMPAYLKWGGWNACPPPEFHVAALKKWNNLYGAELVAICGDFIDIKVKTRPKTRDEAIKLAKELYQYCPDLVDQGSDTISNLAAALLNSDWWTIWWD